MSSTASGVKIEVWVVPGSSRPGLAGMHDGKLRIRVSSPPEGGRANREAADLLGEALGRPARLVRGISSRRKVFEVTGVDAATAFRKLGLGR